MSEEPVKLIGGGEVAELLGVSRERVRQLANGEGTAHPLPEPIAHLGRRRLWLTDDVVAWAVESGRAAAILERHSGRVLELRAEGAA